LGGDGNSSGLAVIPLSDFSTVAPVAHTHTQPVLRGHMWVTAQQEVLSK